jgi:arginine transport system substrate-binding protein
MPIFIKNYKFLFLIISVFFGFFAFKTLQNKESDHNSTLVIGLQSGYPPFEFIDPSGNIVGFDLDVAALIAQKLNKQLVVKDMEFDGEILSLKQGKIDLIVSGMNITPSRLKEIAMVPYHGEAATSLSLIFWNKIPKEVHSIDDIAYLSNPTISVESGTIPETYMERYQTIQAKSFHGALAPLMDVKYGKSTANLVEPDVATYLKKQHPEIKILDVPLEKDEEILGFGIGVKKENTALVKQIQQIIQELKASGELKKLESKWFKGEE